MNKLVNARGIVNCLLEDEPDKEEIVRLVGQDMRWHDKYPNKLAPLGSVSHGTLRTQDLIRRFMAMLRWLDPERAQEVEQSNQEIFGEDADLESENASYFLNDDLMEILQGYAPPYTYFGASEGDGADFGYWISQELDDEIVAGGEVITYNSEDEIDWNEVAESDANYVAVMLDKHNVCALWDAEFKKELWSI